MSRVLKVLPMLALAALVLGSTLPFLFALLASLTPESELFAGTLVPTGLTLAHYRGVLEERGFAGPILNSLLVAASTTALCVPLASLCAYALARLRFRGKTLILAFVLAVSMFPQIAIVSPLYLVLRALGLIDTRPGLILPYVTFALPLSVWLLNGYFRQLPRELEEAAAIDGASRFRTFISVVLPLAIPGVLTTALLTFVYCWNEFLFALSFTVTPEKQTVPVAIALMRGRYQVSWGQMLAATLLATAPVAALVLAFQKRIVSGLTAGALKG